MARTEIYTIRKKDGRLKSFCDVPCASQGALHTWISLEKKYLPSLPTPGYFKPRTDYQSRFCFGTAEDRDEFWKLVDDPRLTWEERVVLETTYDFAIIRTKDLLEVADAYENVWFSSENMKKQAEVFREIVSLNDKTIRGIWKLETSVCCISDFARQTINGYLYTTHKFYDAIQYLRDMKSVNYNKEEYEKLYNGGN